MSVYLREGASVYSYDFQVRGHRFSGSTGCTTKREAKQWEKDEKLKIKARPADPNRPLNFADVTTLYWNEKGKHHVNNHDTEASLAWLQNHVGKLTLVSDINNATIARLVAIRRSEEVTRPRRSKQNKGGRKPLPPQAPPRTVSAATVNRSVIEPMRAIMIQARDTWNCTVNPINWGKHKLKEPEERVREASLKEEEIIRSSIRLDYEPAIKFAVETGCRLSEIVGIQWTSVDFFNRDFRVKGKGDKSRTIPMTDEIHALLWSLKDHHSVAVFIYIAQRTRDGRIKDERYPMTLNGLKTAWRRGPKQTEVQDFRFHDIRHTAATRLVRKTGNIRLAQRLLGHSDIKTTARYAHVTHDDLRAGMEATSRAQTSTQTPTETKRPKTKYRKKKEE